MKAKKKKTLFIIGLIAMLIGISVIGVFGWKRISHEIEKQRLLKECVVFEIPDLEIKAPVMDGTEHEVLSKAAGHFPAQVQLVQEITVSQDTTAPFMRRSSTR